MAPPLDLEHLKRQTMGDAALQAEVLALFVRQARGIRSEIAGAGEAERQQLAHKLKGAARGIGAFLLADCAAAVETDPGLQRALDALTERIDETCDFIPTIAG